MIFGKTKYRPLVVCVTLHCWPWDAVTTLGDWLAQRSLRINASKTKTMFVCPRGKDVDDQISVSYAGKPLGRTDHYKYLGLTINHHLSWSTHIDNIYRKVAPKIGALRRAHHLLDRRSRRLYYLAVLQGDMEYASSAFFPSLSAADKDRLERLSKRAIRAVYSVPPWTHTHPLFHEINITPLLPHLDMKLLSYVYRCTHLSASPLLCSQFSLRSASDHTARVTRGQSSLALAVPSAHTSSGSRTPVFTGTLKWNTLPLDLRTAPSLSCFKRKLLSYNGYPVRRP